MKSRQDALIALRAAVDTAGGPSAVARAARMQVTHLCNVLGGHRGLGRETAARLRAHVSLSPSAWLELLAPLPLDAAQRPEPVHPRPEPEAPASDELDDEPWLRV